MIRIAQSLVALSFLALAVLAPPAAANVPGSNGAITFRYDDYTTPPYTYDYTTFVDPASGADARPTVGPYGNSTDGHAFNGRMWGNADSRHVALNSFKKEPHSGGTLDRYWRGGLLGNVDSLGVMLSSNPIFPDLVVGADLCNGDAKVVAALADGNLLWQRSQVRRPACNSMENTTRQFDYTITTATGSVVRRVFEVSGDNSTQDPLGTVFGAAGDPNVAYAVKAGGSEPGFYRVDLANQTTTRLSMTVPFTPNDVSPDGRWIVGAGGGAIKRFDTLTGDVVTLIDSATAANVAPVAPTPHVDYPVVSPDGTQVAFERHNATDAGTTFDAVVAIGIDGSNPRVVRQLAAHHFFVAGALSWHPAPGLKLELEGGQLVGDLVELDLRIINPSTSPFSPLRFDTSGHTEGLIFNTALYSPEHRAQFTMVSGPAPAMISSIGATTQSQHQWVLGIDRPGNVQVRSKAYATGSTGSEVQVEQTTYVVARNRHLEQVEEAMTVGGAWAEVHSAMQDDFDQLMTRQLLRINAKLPANMRKPTAFERGMAEVADLPSNAMAWLPADTKKATDAFVAYNVAHANARDKVWKKKLGSAYNTTIKVPFEYWSEQLTGDAATTVPVGTALYDEGAYWANRGSTAAKGFANDAYALVTDPRRRHEVGKSVETAILAMDDKVRRIPTVAPAKAKQIADAIRKDPVKGAQALGTFTGTLEAEATFMAAEVAFTPNKAGIARGVKNVGTRVAGFVDDVGDTARSIKASRTVAKVDDNLRDAARHGMPVADQKRWQGIVKQVEDHVAKRGYDVKLELSFRPRNIHSAALGDAGSGKNQFMKGKTGTDIDLMLGMDPSGLGKLVIYKPVKPKNFSKLPKPMRDELTQRIKDIESARAEWLNPKSNLGRARTGKGVTLTGDLKNPTTGEKIGVTKVKMRIAGYEKNGTISIKYLEHVVDGKTIVKPGKPKWVVSDYDGNAILQVGGKDLPGGAVRGLIEAEVMRLQREHGTAMATSFHGFTYNGFDMPASVYRKTFTFLLEGMTKQQANRALLRYLAKYSTGAKDFEDLVKKYSYGDYVVHVTSDAAFATQGL